MFKRTKRLPRILLIGDSIRMRYAPLVAKSLEDVAKVVVIKENCEDSAKVLANVHKWLRKAGPDQPRVIHFNSGLHDVKRAYGSERRQQPPEAYVDNLRRVVAALRAGSGARLVWATTTPVIFQRHHAKKGFDRFEEDVMEYNRAALALMEELQIPVDDLYGVIMRHGKERAIGEDGVHMTDEGNRALADAVSAYLRGCL
ncbi:MAG: SGNH/GDSL hydrolase family protein [Candidatus Lokiarchaeota archaeon]|nr:SGNH/GDSL hydrolase family protein [Candidatus Lokiarchaeota archaeon]